MWESIPAVMLLHSDAILCPNILNIYFMAAQTVLKPVSHCP